MMSIKQNLLTVLAILLTTSIATTSIFFTNQAIAQLAPTGPTKQVQGGGIGTVTCPDGTSVSSVSMSFSADKDKGKMSGAAGMFDQTTFTSIGVLITDGTVKKGTFTLQGVATDRICHIPGSSLATISGLCGTGVTIQYTDATGARAIFPNANVACFV